MDIEPETGMESASKSLPDDDPTQEKQSRHEPAQGHALLATALSPHPWAGYLTGSATARAMGAAQALARGERGGISPLVVYGPSGVGKSRLLAGLVAERLRRQPSSSVAHLDAQAFVTACFEAAGDSVEAGWT